MMRETERPRMLYRGAVLGLLGIAAISFSGLLVGCAVGGYIAHAIGPMPVKPQYVPPKTPTAVLVKDQPNPTGELVESDALTSQIQQQLQEHEVGPLVPTLKIAELRSDSGQKFEEMSPAAVGRALGANQIILVQILSSSTSAGPGNDMLKGKIAAAVSVYDAKSGSVLWPTDGSPGASVEYETPMVRAGEDVNDLSVRRNLYAGLADHVAKLFYTYKPDSDAE